MVKLNNLKAIVHDESMDVLESTIIFIQYPLE